MGKAARHAPAALDSTEPPARYRATSFGKPLAGWRPRRVLAIQDAIDAGQGSREWDSGRTYTGPGVHIETEPGAMPIGDGERRQAQALAFHQRHGSAAPVRAATKRASFPDESDDAQLWAEIVEELRTIKAEALRAERGRLR